MSISISLVINVIFLKMAITHVKRDALATGYCSKEDSIDADVKNNNFETKKAHF